MRAAERFVRALTGLEFTRTMLLAASAGLLFSFVAAYVVGRWECWVATVEFAAAAKSQAMALQNGVDEYLGRLKALRTFFESANDEITRSEFEVFSRRLFEEHPGILRVNWAPRVRRKDRAEYENAALEDGVVGYHFQSRAADGALVPAAEANEYYPILYSTVPKTSKFYGFDLASDEARRTTLERARDHDVIAALPAVSLFLRNDLNGIFVAVPVYVKGTSRDSVADRRRNIAGFIIGLFELPQLLEAVVAPIASSRINVDIYSAASGLDTLSIRGSEPGLSAVSLAKRRPTASSADPRWTGTLKVGDASWTLSATPVGGGRLAVSYGRALTVVVAGIVVTAIIVAYIGFTSRHSRRLELANRRVFELAQTDVLTGLANRRVFFDRLSAVFAQARLGGKGFAVLYFDLDHFKDVNDTLGHAFGDELLRQVAERVRAAVPPTNLVARFGGDEFAVLECDVDDAAPADTLAGKIGTAVAAPYEINGAVVHMTASIGIARYAPDLANADAVMVQADLALYRAKEDGRNCCRMHSHELGQQVNERVTIADELRGAIERGELELYYQPQVELATGRILGLEALLRWFHPTRGPVSPALFIPIAERSGSILPLGRWAFDEACRQYRAWQDAGIAPKILAVNFSAVQFKAAASLERDIAKSLSRWQVMPGHMEVELTESVLMEVSAQYGDTLERLRRSGLRIALDDFGIGYSSLNYLTAYPVNRLKIAQELVFGVTTERRSAVVVRTAIQLARELGIEFIAEGVETEAQASFLASAGCEQAQGFYFSRPVSAAHTTELLRERRIKTAELPRAKALTAA
ncbi:MAG: putative bifunctional diguanylate cyclase/phosphodiesterase [Xanthobacteraceae bacterium]